METSVFFEFLNRVKFFDAQLEFKQLVFTRSDARQCYSLEETRDKAAVHVAKSRKEQQIRLLR